MTTDYDIQGRLREYFPIFFELLGDNGLKWRTVEKVFGRKLDGYKRKFDLTGEPIIVEASLFHIITSSISGNEQAKRLLDFITKLFEELILRLDKEEKKLIKNNLFGLITNINREYHNFLGELCVLNSVKKNTKLKLVKTEEPLDPAKPSGSKIDFTFLNSETERRHLVEVVNIQIDGYHTLSDEEINNQLTQKIDGKLNRTGIRTNSNFLLIPVVWGPKDDLLKLIKYYEKFNPQFKNTSVPTGFATCFYDEEKYVHRFGTINTLLSK